MQAINDASQTKTQLGSHGIKESGKQFTPIDLTKMQPSPGQLLFTDGIHLILSFLTNRSWIYAVRSCKYWLHAASTAKSSRLSVEITSSRIQQCFVEALEKAATVAATTGTIPTAASPSFVRHVHSVISIPLCDFSCVQFRRLILHPSILSALKHAKIYLQWSQEERIALEEEQKQEAIQADQQQQQQQEEQHLHPSKLTSLDLRLPLYDSSFSHGFAIAQLLNTTLFSSACRSLTHLTLNNLHLGTDIRSMISLVHLSHLRLENYKTLSNQIDMSGPQARSILEHMAVFDECPSLTSLDFDIDSRGGSLSSSMHESNFASILQIMKWSHTQLTRIRFLPLHGAMIKTASSSYLTSYYLNLDAIVTAFPNLYRLAPLEFDLLNEIVGDSLLKFESLESICIRLSSSSSSSTWHLSDSCVQSLLSCSSLTRIECIGWQFRSSKDWSQLLNRLPNLSQLEFRTIDVMKLLGHAYVMGALARAQIEKIDILHPKRLDETAAEEMFLSLLISPMAMSSSSASPTAPLFLRASEDVNVRVHFSSLVSQPYLIRLVIYPRAASFEMTTRFGKRWIYDPTPEVVPPQVVQPSQSKEGDVI